MTGIITSLPPLVEQPPGSNASNPAGLPGVTYTAAVPTLPQTWTGLQTFAAGSIEFAGSTSGNTFLNASAIASGTLALPAVSTPDTLLANNNIATVTNKSIDGLQNTLTNLPASSFGSVTGSGPVVLQTSPTLITPILGTPTSVTLTNATGLPIATGVAGLAAGVSTFLATPSSANLRVALTDETGTGAAYFQGGDIGTPSAGVATNITGLPISTGVSGLAAGVAAFLATPSSANLRTALTDEVGTGAAYFVGGALGTPASATLTNGTGLPISTGVSGLGTGVSTFLATPSSANLAAALTDETGTGAAVFATSPTLVTPLLGTPTSGTLTNCTGLPVGGLAAQAAFTFVGNNTSGSATPTAVDIATLTSKASPVATDLVMISDQAASGAWKKVTVSSLASAGSVSSIAGNTGAFTLGTGLTNAVNDIRLSVPVSIANGGTGDTGAAWTTYTPTCTSSAGTITTVSATGRSKTVGKTVFVNVTVTITTAGTGAGALLIPLPVNAQGSNNQALVAIETVLLGVAATASILTSNATRVQVVKYDGSTYIASGAVITISGVYESV